MKSFKSIIKVAAVAVAAVTMSGTLTSCDVVAESMLDAAFAPDYVVTREVYHYNNYNRPHVRSYYSTPTHYSRGGVVRDFR